MFADIKDLVHLLVPVSMVGCMRRADAGAWIPSVLQMDESCKRIKGDARHDRKGRSKGWRGTLDNGRACHGAQAWQIVKVIWLRLSSTRGAVSRKCSSKILRLCDYAVGGCRSGEEQ